MQPASVLRQRPLNLENAIIQRNGARFAPPNRERKRLLAHIIEDAKLNKIPAERITKIHVRFKGGKTETLAALNPKSSAQQTPSEIVELVDTLLDHHIYSEIADILNKKGCRPGGSAQPGRSDARFTALRVAYLVHEYDLRPRNGEG